MPQIDNALKLLITSFSEVFAAWLLGSPPRQVQSLNVELPASATRGDLIFDVVQADGTPVLLHIELQGLGSHSPMPWRMLDYMTRLAQREMGELLPGNAPQLFSVVIYLGQGVGANDPGEYQIMGPAGWPSLSWRYRPILLWEMEAEELLRLGEPAFLALIGQVRLRDPERELQEAVTRIQQVAEKGQRRRLLGMLGSLISDKEALKVVEKLLEDPLDEYLLELPAQQRILQKGREQGREEGTLAGLREAIQEIIIQRFNPPAREYLQVSRQLEEVTLEESLRRLLVAAIHAEDMAAFAARLTEELPEAQPATTT